MEWYDMRWCDITLYVTICDMVWYDMKWYNMMHGAMSYETEREKDERDTWRFRISAPRCYNVYA